MNNIDLLLGFLDCLTTVAGMPSLDNDLLLQLLADPDWVEQTTSFRNGWIRIAEEFELLRERSSVIPEFAYD
ncbi:MAG: hypothetical protein AAF671_08765 [Pseudomonadota bacterium]